MRGQRQIIGGIPDRVQDGRQLMNGPPDVVAITLERFTVGDPRVGVRLDLTADGWVERTGDQVV